MEATDNVSKETHVVSVMLVREGKDDRLLPHPIRRQSRLTARDKKSSQGLGSKQENSKDKSEIPCRSKFCKNPSCKSWHPPVCQKYKSETGFICGDKCHFRHVEAEVTSSKK